jgi:hypothetical protein
MDATTLLITVYCLVDEWLAGRRLRQRGPQPILSDSEVLTIEWRNSQDLWIGVSRDLLITTL